MSGLTADDYRAALQEIMQCLGPNAPTTCCSGCEAEIEHALAICRKAGIEYRSRREHRKFTATGGTESERS